MIRYPLLAITAALIAAHPAVAATTHAKVRQVVVKKVVASNGTTKMTVTGDPAARALIANCGEKKFETQADVIDPAGHRRLTRIKLCAKPGEDPATWVKSLRSAQASINGTTSLPQATRAEIVAALQTEITKTEAEAASKPTLPPAK